MVDTARELSMNFDAGRPRESALREPAWLPGTRHDGRGHGMCFEVAAPGLSTYDELSAIEA
jgi:hypothetical protein